MTGGGRSLGKTIACRMTESGAAVVLAGRHHEHLEQAVELVESQGGTATAAPCDLADPEQARRPVGRAARNFVPSPPS